MVAIDSDAISFEGEESYLESEAESDFEDLENKKYTIFSFLISMCKLWSLVRRHQPHHLNQSAARVASWQRLQGTHITP